MMLAREISVLHFCRELQRQFRVVEDEWYRETCEFMENLSFTGAFPSRKLDTLFFQTNLVARRTEFRTYGCSTIGRTERMQFSYANAISWHHPPRSFSRQTSRKSKLQENKEVGLETISVWLRCRSSSIFYAAATENVKASTIIWIVIAILTVLITLVWSLIVKDRGRKNDRISGPDSRLDSKRLFTVYGTRTEDGRCT